jgi:hypothetical protein
LQISRERMRFTAREASGCPNDLHSGTLQKKKRRRLRRRIVSYDKMPWGQRQAHRALRGVLSPFDIDTDTRFAPGCIFRASRCPRRHHIPKVYRGGSHESRSVACSRAACVRRRPVL